MSLFLFLTVVQALVAAALVGIVLIQRSEGGGLGVGGGSGNPGGLMSARGAADFLTRTTKWLAIDLRRAGDRAWRRSRSKATSGGTVDDSLKRDAPSPRRAAQPQPRAGPGSAAPAAIGPRQQRSAEERRAVSRRPHAVQIG